MNYYPVGSSVSGDCGKIGDAQISFGAGAGAAQAPSPIEQRLEELEKLAEVLNFEISGLYATLSSVLIPQMKNESGSAQATPKPVPAPMVHVLDSIASKINNAINSLRDIRDRSAL